jgi:hypothetical protein
MLGVACPHIDKKTTHRIALVVCIHEYDVLPKERRCRSLQRYHRVLYKPSTGGLGCQSTLSRRVYLLMSQIRLCLKCISYGLVSYKDCLTMALMIMFIDFVSRSNSQSLKNSKSLRCLSLIAESRANVYPGVHLTTH